MAKIIITGTTKFTARIRDLIKNKVADDKFLTQVATQMRDDIYDTVKSGKHIGNGKTKSLPGLASSYIKYRRKYQALGGYTGNLFSPGKSNLTFTGQMLESMLALKNSREKTASVKVPATMRQPPTNISNRKIKPQRQLTNADVARSVAERTPFLGITQTALKQIIKDTINDLRTKISRVGLKSNKKGV